MESAVFFLKFSKYISDIHESIGIKARLLCFYAFLVSFMLSFSIVIILFL